MKIIWMAKCFIIAESENYIDISLYLLVFLFINNLFLTKSIFGLLGSLNSYARISLLGDYYFLFQCVYTVVLW